MTTSDAAGAGTAESLLVTAEDDPTPLVLSLSRTVRAAGRRPELRAAAATLTGVIGVRSSADHQSATFRSSGGRIHIVHGVSADADLVIGWDAATEFELRTLPGQDDERIAVLTAVLNPPLPPWQDAATRFWRQTGSDPGMPGKLVVRCTDTGEELALGDAPAGVILAGGANQLARTLSGLGNLFDDLYAGALSLAGT
ncbi:MAG: hypothetical protein HOV79_13135, partial [Hamadaea sp.]|nr:hypothetical protein [Hamadaea sp.]